MKIAVTGALGVVGRVVVAYCEEEGHEIVQIDLPEAVRDQKPRNFFGVNVAEDYHGLLRAMQGCNGLIHLAAFPHPRGRDDYITYGTNVRGSFNVMRAAGELGIRKVCQASSCNALGLSYANQPLHFDYFPLDEEAKARPTDSYSMSKQTCEQQADCFVLWFPGMSVASMRFHAVKNLKAVKADWADKPDAEAQEMWAWTSPRAAARACLLSIDADRFKGHEVFNIVAPYSTRSDVETAELARQFYPKTEIRNLKGHDSIWTSAKAERILGWKHTETE